MAISTRHPVYTEFVEDWELIRDCYRGERVVKEQGQKYLPATAGMVADGMETSQPGLKAYEAYKVRALFPDFVSEAVEVALGMMHSRPATIELPSIMESLRDRATVNGEGLEHLLRRINEQQLVAGRLGLLADLPLVANQSEPLPYIAIYRAEDIINWDDNEPEATVQPRLHMVVLNETELERREDFTWEIVEKYRLLALIDPNGRMSNEPSSVYGAAVFAERDAGYTPDRMVVPSIRGRRLEQVPFVIINTKDLVARPDDPPLLGLARLSLAVYRGEADYRHNLFMQGQDTLVLIGDMAQDEERRVGAGALIRLPQGGDAKYVGVTSQGLSEQRQALENDRAQAMQRTGALLNSGGGKESGEALKIRVAAQTASLKQIAMTGGAGLQSILRTIAEWVGANPEEVKVSPNIEFDANDLNPDALGKLMGAKTMGAPLSRRSIHGLLRDRGFTNLEYEEELAELEAEAPADTGGGTDAGGNPEDEPDPSLEPGAPQ